MAIVLNAGQLRKMGVSRRTGSELVEVVGSFLSGYVHLTIPFKSGEKQMKSLSFDLRVVLHVQILPMDVYEQG